jgi:hypothetical protein
MKAGSGRYHGEALDSLPGRLMLPPGLVRLFVLLMAGLALNACGGGDEGSAPPATYTIGGTISGLAGNVTLQLNGGNSLGISANGGFTFSTSLGSGATYSITVSVQPGSPAQTCSVSNGNGTVGSSNVTSAQVSCATNTYAVGGLVSGLAGGSSVVVQNSGGPLLTISANGAFSFPAPVSSGASYAVTVATQPLAPPQQCTVSRGTGGVGAAAVTDVQITCINTYSIGGTITGLAGTGLTLHLNLGGDIAISPGSTSFVFPNRYVPGTSYEVTASALPGGPAQNCSIVGGLGSIGSQNVATIQIRGTTLYRLQVSVTGLGTAPIGVHAGTQSLNFVMNGTQSFLLPIEDGSIYDVVLDAQPVSPPQVCTVQNGHGQVSGADVTNVTVSCRSYYSVGGTISGLSGTVVLQNNGGNNLSIAANGGFTFSSQVLSGSPYAVTVQTQPAGLVCAVVNGSGTVAANVANVAVTCSAPPVVSVSLNQAKISLGSTLSVTWSATNATSCTASGAWTGTRTISGSAAQTPAVAGANVYTLSCSGAGGTTVRSVTATVWIPPMKSSYENKIAAAAAIGPQYQPFADAIAYADFFQDGSYSMVTHPPRYNMFDPSTADQLGFIYFWKKVNGTWVNRTSELLSDNVGCLHPRKAIVADFNDDQRPDVFFACFGFDTFPAPGEQQRLLLSRPDGTYSNTLVPDNSMAHAAAAADVDGDGDVDVVLMDSVLSQGPHVLINTGNGAFARDLSRLPQVPAVTVELIDVDRTGKYDLVMSGRETNSVEGVVLPPLNAFAPTILKNDGFGRYVSTPSVTLPTLALPSGETPIGEILDLLFVNNTFYLLRTNVYNAGNSYNATAIQKIAYPSLTSSAIYTHRGAYPNPTNVGLPGWINWIIPYQGNIVGIDSAYGVSVPQ